MADKKIIIVTPYIYPEPGGLEKFVYEISVRLAKTSQILIISGTRRKSIDISGKHIKQVFPDNIDIVKLKPDFYISNTPIKTRLLTYLLNAIDMFTPDIIYTHTPVAFFSDVGVISAKFKQVPVITHVHSGSLYKGCFTDLISFIYKNTLEKLSLGLSDLITASSYFVKQNYLRKYSNVDVIYPGVNRDIFYFDSSVSRIEKSILFVGQLTKAHIWKGLDILLKACRLLYNRGYQFKLTVVGDGNLKNYYISLTQKLGLEERVSFSGFLPEYKLADIYRNHEVFVLPSKGNLESFGMVLLEAAACGCNIIGSNAGGIPEILGKIPYSLGFEAGNYRQLADNIISSFEADNINRKKISDATVSFSWEQAVTRLNNIFEILQK